MAKSPARYSFFSRFADRRSVARWREAERGAHEAGLDTLRQRTDSARALRGAIDDFLHISENRLALPRIGSNAFFRPAGADWSWRPEVCRGPLPVIGQSGLETRTWLGGELELFHDCPRREITLRQIRNKRERDLAPYGLRLEVFQFDGSFLSMALGLPPEAAHGLKKRHLIRFDAIVEVENPIEIYARLNVQHGPNTEQIVRALPLDESEVMLEFDLGYSDLNEKRAERIWLDLIFDNPDMNQITVRDMTFSRSPRAEM